MFLKSLLKKSHWAAATTHCFLRTPIVILHPNAISKNNKLEIYCQHILLNKKNMLYYQIERNLKMIYLYSVFSLLIGFYSLPLMIDVIKSNHEVSHLSTTKKFLYFLSCFLFLTFPFVNFVAFLEGMLLQSSYSSYVSGIYGIIFISFSFVSFDK